MLKNLYIKNFVLIEELSLDFHDSFSSFTGETGAGKSIMIDAISLLSLERSSTSFIMKDKDVAIIEGTFDLTKDDYAIQVLEEAGFSVEDDTIFTREINKNGKSTSRINHRIVTFSLMQEALKYQIDIHNQRDNAYLLNVSNHLTLLDKYSKDDKELLKVKEKYEVLDKLLKEKDKALNETFSESDLEYFEYQIKEIDNSKLVIGEDIELEEKEKAYKTVKTSFDSINEIINLFREEIEGPLFNLNNKVSSLDNNETFNKIKENINDSYYSIDDSISSLSSYLNNFDFSEESINEMEERLFELQRLKRKYSTDIEGILKLREDLISRVEMYENKQAFLDNIDKEIKKAKEDYDKAALALSKVRKSKAKDLDKEVIKHLKDLGLENAKFETEIKDRDASLLGSDDVEFYVSMNKGEALKPLNKTASGGELSRLMLGLKVIFTNLQGIETVIFDEIDTGVSGKIASEIGYKMKELGNSAQVFSVTHLAQVAACAKTNYKVIKETIKDKVRTSVKELKGDEIIEELALISTGVVTSSSLEAAKELYKRNQK